MYAPQLGRFCSRDLILYDGGTALYEYVRGSVITLTDPNGLWPWSDKYCNGEKYTPYSHCCEDNKVVKKKSIWLCERALGFGTIGTCLYWGVPTNYVLPHCYQAKHSYVCCSGANQDCYGKQAKNDGVPAKKGDPIPREVDPSGSCRFFLVCPNTWDSKCNNPKANEDYGWVTPGYENCTDWAWRGLK